jgi:hypothetical protein
MATVVALPVNKLEKQALDTQASLYPESQAEDWVGDEEAMRSHAISVCENAWALVYTPLIDGPKPARAA